MVIRHVSNPYIHETYHNCSDHLIQRIFIYTLYILERTCAHLFSTIHQPPATTPPTQIKNLCTSHLLGLSDFFLSAKMRQHTRENVSASANHRINAIIALTCTDIFSPRCFQEANIPMCEMLRYLHRDR